MLANAFFRLHFCRFACSVFIFWSSNLQQALFIITLPPSNLLEGDLICTLAPSNLFEGVVMCISASSNLQRQNTVF